jgi:hypothetical protein
MRSHFIAITLRHVPTAAIIIATIAALIVTPVEPVWGAQAASAVSLSAWAAPADVDQTIPEVRTDIACPLPLLLQGASARVQELVANLHQFSAREQIEHIEIRKNGSLRRARKSTFNYVAQINQVSGSPSVEEFRVSANRLETAPGEMIDTGTAAFALIFHLSLIEHFVMSCEGLADVRSRAAWQLRFSQRPNQKNLFHVYRVGNNYYPAKLKGRAWIAVDNYEVLRLQTDLIEPIGQIRLLREHSDIHYGAVEFRKQNVRLWLPQSADLYMDFRGHRYQRRHNFSNFQLFSVETGQTVGELKAKEKK